MSDRNRIREKRRKYQAKAWAERNRKKPFPNGYKEYHRFPSGLEVKFSSQLGEIYQHDLMAISSQEQLNAHIDKWKYLCDDLASVPLAELISLRNNKDAQNEAVERAGKGDKIAAATLNLLIPQTLVLLMIKAQEFVVPEGMILLQLWNGGYISERDGGFWKLNWS